MRLIRQRQLSGFALFQAALANEFGMLNSQILGCRPAGVSAARIALIGALALSAGFALQPSVAQAQVTRCLDARTGKVTYTDGSCDAGHRGTQVQARKTELQLEQERAAAADAIDRKKEKQAAQDQAEQRQLERDALDAQRSRDAARQRSGDGGADYGNSSDCANARRALTSASGTVARTPEEQATRIDAAQQQMDFACLGPDGYARAQAIRASQAPIIVVQPPIWPGRPPRPIGPRPNYPAGPHIQGCTSFTCTDTNGKRYPRTGAGSFNER